KNTFEHHSKMFEKLFAALSEIIGYAQEKSLHDRIVIYVHSDRGKQGVDLPNGSKQHWPYASALLWGNPLKSGHYGAVDQFLRGDKIDLTFGSIDREAGSVLEERHIYASIFLISNVQLPFMEQFPPLAFLVK